MRKRFSRLASIFLVLFGSITTAAAQTDTVTSVKIIKEATNAFKCLVGVETHQPARYVTVEVYSMCETKSIFKDSLFIPFPGNSVVDFTMDDLADNCGYTVYAYFPESPYPVQGYFSVPANPTSVDYVDAEDQWSQNAVHDYRVYSVSGRLIGEFQKTNYENILQQLEKGMYIIHRSSVRTKTTVSCKQILIE